MKRLLVILLLSLLFAPARWGIALNYETRQCAGYWGGDEYGTYVLPKGWQAYYPGAKDLIETEIGVCHWDADNWDQRAENCCRELGYPYVADNIGEAQAGTMVYLMIFGLCLACGGVLAVIGGLGLVFGGGFWLWKRQKKTPPQG